MLFLLLFAGEHHSWNQTLTVLLACDCLTRILLSVSCVTLYCDCQTITHCGWRETKCRTDFSPLSPTSHSYLRETRTWLICEVRIWDSAGVLSVFSCEAEQNLKHFHFYPFHAQLGGSICPLLKVIAGTKEKGKTEIAISSSGKRRGDNEWSKVEGTKGTSDQQSCWCISKPFPRLLSYLYRNGFCNPLCVYNTATFALVAVMLWLSCRKTPTQFCLNELRAPGFVTEYWGNNNEGTTWAC